MDFAVSAFKYTAQCVKVAASALCSIFYRLSLWYVLFVIKILSEFPYHIPIQTLENKQRLNWFLMLMTPNYSVAQKNQ